jgi:phosphoribosyl-AMP cyclohydrolase
MRIPVAERSAEHTIALLDFDKLGGLVTVVTQDASDGRVLMTAFASPEAVRRTLTDGWAFYYSRSRKKLWKKGESSGHLQRVREVRIDCDGDSVLYLVEQTGAACHTGFDTCFYRTVDDRGLEIIGSKISRPS